MSKQIQNCILISLIFMAAAIYVTCEYVFDNRDNFSTSVHLTAEMIELKDIRNNQIDDVKFSKALSIYTGILYINEQKDVNEYTDLCDYIYENYDQDIINIIEERVKMQSENKIRFINGFKNLKRLCANVKK